MQNTEGEVWNDQCGMNVVNYFIKIPQTTKLIDIAVKASCSLQTMCSSNVK